MKKYVRRCFPAIMLLAVLCAPQARAGGLFVYEMGTPDVGVASAGWAARAQDASTVFTNPAGMTRLPGSNMTLGAQAIYGKAQFDPDASTGPQTGDDGGNAVGWVPGGSFFFTQQVNGRWTLGIGSFSYFGGAVDYHENWAGRYFVQNSMLAGMTVMPAVAYRFNDMISVGAGLNAMYGMFKNEKGVNTLLADGDGKMTLEDETWGYGANVGVLIESGGTRVGLTYLSEVKLDFSDVPEYENLGAAMTAVLEARGMTSTSLDLGVKVPQCVMMSVYQKLGDKFALMGNVGWQDWSNFGEVEIGVNSSDPVSLTTESTYDDTWHVALGGQYQASDKLMLSMGFAYDSSLFKDKYRSPALPIGETWRGALGTQYMVNDRLKLGLDYEFAWSGDLDMYRSTELGGTLSGTYKDSYLHIVALSATMKF